MEQVQKPPIIKLEQVVLKGFGINVHEKTIVVTLNGEVIKKETRTFETFTSSLIECRTWLKQLSINHELWRAQEYIGNTYKLNMKKIFGIQAILIAVISMVLFSCYSSKPLQKFPTIEEIEPKLVLGKSTYTQMLDTFGKPSTASKNFIGYSLVKASNGIPLYLSLLFKDSFLAGYKILQPGVKKIEKGIESVIVD